jgi:hypothetical protein
LNAHLQMLRPEDAQVPDEGLDPVARRLKQTLLARMTEAVHAA